MAVQDAELKLKVSLDLAFFRQQLSGLGQAAAGYNVPINVKFDRRSVQNELNALGRNISQRTYRLEVATNISAEIKNAEKLAKLLREMPAGSSGVAGTTGKGLGQKAFLGVSPAEIKRLYKVAGDAGLISFRESIANNKEKIAKELGSVGKDSIAGLLNGLNSQNPQLQKAAEALGKDLIASVKGVLGIASPSREFRKIGEDSGKGFEQGLIRAMEIAEKSATRQLQRMLDRLARMALMAGGMSAAEISRQAGAGIAQRMMPAPSWAATAPSRSSSIGPSSSGRLLAGAPAMRGLPGSVYGEQKRLVGDILSPSLKEVLRGAANAFADAVRTELNSAVRSVQVRDLGRTMRAALSPQRTAGLLSAGVGRAPSVYSTGGIGGESREQMIARRTREAYMRSAQREMDVMGGGAGRPAAPYSYANRAARPRSAMVPYSAGGALVPMGGGAGGAFPPRPPSGGGGGGMGGMGGFGRALGGINVPGTGVVREIGNEFAMATKQVLLFGTAYKALAFLTSFPAQVGQAVGALQSFNNTLKAISPSAAEARTSNQFILDIVDRYNVPLQSARDGFTKLYASMAPAGFKGDEIRALFTGVSQAAATFGMSAEKVDRVNYAFAQMASKGQVMSEELKGQLGDVLPGAMGIFAEAAGFKGPKAIEQFSKALEDGAYKGDAMRVLLKNVTGVLQKEFGPGAEGAARTFQGVINRMQNSTQLLYEAFEPVAVGFLNSVVVPLTSGIKTIADGFNAFFTETQAKTTGGMAFAKELEALRPTFEGIQTNLTALIPSFKLFGGVLLNVAKLLATVAGNPITGFLLKVYANVLLVNTVFTLLGGRILVGLIANIGLATSRFIAMNAAVFALQRTSAVANSTLAGTQLQMLLLQRNATGAIGPVNALLGSLLRLAGIGLIAIAVTIAINGANELRDAELRLARLRGERDPVGPEGPRPVMTPSRRFTGASRETVQKARETQAPLVLQYRKELQVLERQLLTAKAIAAASEDNAQASLANTRLKTAQARVDAKRLDIQNAQGILNLDPNKFKTQAELLQSTVQTFNVPGVTGDGASSAKPKKERESQLPMLQLELEKTKELFTIDQQLIGARLADNASLVSSLELQKQLTELKYQGKQIALEQIPLDEKQAKMAALAVEYEKAIMESQLNLQLDMQKAREDLQKSVEDTIKGYELENEYQQRYYELVQQGISPALAKIRVEVEKTFRKEKERIDTLIEQYKLQKASLEVQLNALIAQGNLSDIDSKRLADIKERIRLLDLELEKMGLLKGGLPGAQEGAIVAAEGAAQSSPARVRLAELAEESRLALEKLQDPVEQIKVISDSVSESIGSAFKGLVTGATTAQEALANVFQSIADSFVDMVAQMITEWLRAQLIKGFMSFFPGSGALAGATSVASTGLSFDPGGMAGFSVPWTFAKGGIAPGGFQAFANGGIVKGPTLGLVGEGRYNEAVIPLPDGKSVPVDLGGAMGGQAVNNIVVNVDAKGSSVEGNESGGKELGRVMASAIQQELIKQKRPGGLLA
jgi:tape measure domain-containing protein